MKAKNMGGVIEVAFEKPHEWYYAHSIREEGNVNDQPSVDTMWGWVNHLRKKNWWTDALENEFISLIRSLL